MTQPTTTRRSSTARTARSDRQSGFTLVELVIVMIVVAILAAIAVPSYRYVTTSNRMATQINALLGDLQYARSEAVREGTTVTVCIAQSVVSPQSCQAAGNTSWQNGWLVFTDLQSDQTLDPGDVVLREQSPFTHGDTMQSDNNVTAISFNREGFAYLTGVAKATITLQDSSANSAFTRCLVVTQAGSMTTYMHSSDATDCP